jgi:hypothetical protein
MIDVENREITSIKMKIESLKLSGKQEQMQDRCGRIQAINNQRATRGSTLFEQKKLIIAQKLK